MVYCYCGHHKSDHDNSSFDMPCRECSCIIFWRDPNREEHEHEKKLIADPTRMAEQLCTCGHSRLGHDGGFMKCDIVGCNCRRFTWRLPEEKTTPTTCYCCDETAVGVYADTPRCKWHKPQP